MNLSPVLCFSLVVTSSLVPRVPLHAYAPLHSTHTVGFPTVCIFDTQGYCSVPKETYSALFWEGRGTVAPVDWLGRSLSLTLFSRVSLSVGMFRAPSAGGQVAYIGVPRTRGSQPAVARHGPHNLHSPSCLEAPTHPAQPPGWQGSQVSPPYHRIQRGVWQEQQAETNSSGLLTADVPKLASKHSGPRRGLMCLSSCSLQVLSWRRISQVIWLCFILETWAEKIEI